MNVKGSKAVFTPDRNNPAMFNAFTALAGTDNVRPFGQMVAQNHNDLGDKVITKIIVYSNGRTHTATEKDKAAGDDADRFAAPDIVMQLDHPAAAKY